MSEHVRTEEVGCVVCAARDAEPVGSGVDFEYATCDNQFHYVRCRGCGHVYLQNRPVPSELTRIYPPSYANYASERERALTFRVKAWLDARRMRELERVAGHPPARVLDVGCADGRLLDLCRRVFPQVQHLHGIEISEQAAAAARRKGYPITLGTVDTLTLPESSFDLVFLQQVIEHVYAPDRVFRMLRDALRPGGLLVVETPTTDGLDFKWLHRRYWGGYHAPRHFNLFNADSLLRLCGDAGLEPVRVRYSPQPIHWVWSLHHWLVDHRLPSWTHQWLHIQNPIAIGAGTLVELAAGAATHVMSNMQVVARRPS